MSLRYRKSVKIAPGIKLNFSKSGMGVSVGTKGARVSVSPKGKVTRTLGIPGTGLYDVETISTGKKKQTSVQTPPVHIDAPKTPFFAKTWFSILMLILFFPAGLFTMWRFVEWSTPVKIIVSVFFVLASIIAFI